MQMKPQLVLLAQYNSWLNRQLFHVASQLPAEELREDRQAFLVQSWEPSTTSWLGT